MGLKSDDDKRPSKLAIMDDDVSDKPKIKASVLQDRYFFLWVNTAAPSPTAATADFRKYLKNFVDHQ
ncbi:hypothetical protein SFRURICE_015721 [Spodoptera frugiperda]|nr:hypothetical protein SFRURICE_015721 [Spodoptera frugiperda]